MAEDLTLVNFFPDQRPPGDRRYRYVPTYVLRGLIELHLEFDVNAKAS